MFALNDLSLVFWFVINAAGRAVPCGGPKKYPRTSLIVQFLSSLAFSSIRGQTIFPFIKLYSQFNISPEAFFKK